MEKQRSIKKGVQSPVVERGVQLEVFGRAIIAQADERIKWHKRTAATMEHGRDWEPSPAKAGYVKTLLQQAPTDTALAASIQQAYQAQADAKPKKRKAPPKRGGDVDAGLTPGQRAAAD